MTIHLRQISPSASEAAIGPHTITIDRPEAKGGGDAGPMGGQLFLAAVGGCFMSNLLAAIRAREADISDVRLNVTATAADAPPRFTGLELQVLADTKDPALLDHLIEVADKSCIMMNTLRGTLDLKVVAAAAAKV